MDINYPELYYRVYPKVMDSVNGYLSNNPNPENISDDVLESLVDEVYEKMVEECPEIDEDPIERRGRYRSLQRPFYGRRRLVRDIITIILISELLRRRRPFIFENGYGY
ncbi:hypothetical protein K8M07_04495 [Schnuerera sp. xch1]|uniref:hypothetical protein n=1 Tax=Schnuerera sp. xch1 TaxID=2874283 RepID=UPI001CBCF836|nr:hypothetical protein [Schnuerera sp. xch1]MBZ2174500.1 hypothetical protein [Schnuerera sp. xch1]